MQTGHQQDVETPSQLAPTWLQRLREDDATLCELTLCNHKITDASGTALAAALGTNNTLRVLYVNDNQLTDASGTALAAALGTNTTLRVLSLGSNQLTDASGTALAAALGTNTTLCRLNPPTLLTVASVQLLARNRILVSYRLRLDLIVRKSRNCSVQAVVDAMTYKGLQRAVLKFFLPEAIGVGLLSEASLPDAAMTMEVAPSDRSTMHNGDASGHLPTEDEEFVRVDADIVHSDEAAEIHPEEAAQITSEQHVSWTMLNAGAVGPSGSDFQWHHEFEAVFLHRYSRCPEEFHEALERGSELEPVRAALELAGHEWQLPSGAKILVYSEQFDAVSAVLVRRDLRPHHVVVSQAFEPLVREAVGNLPSRLRVDPLQAEQIAFVGGEHAVVCVERTFLDVPRSLRAPHSVNQSTTEGHCRHRGGVNPRRLSPELITATTA